MSDLPAGWLETTLGEVVDYGKTEKVEPKNIPANAWILELEDIEKDTSRLLQRLTIEQRESKSTKNAFQKGDVLYGKLRPYLNKVLVADDDGFCTTEIIPIKPNTAIDGRYLFYWLKTPEFLSYVNSVSYGLNMPRLGTKDGLAAPLVLAPLDEQKRIAEKLDSLLTRVDSCQSHLERVPQILKRFRQSVLAAATSGRLTEEWRDERGEDSNNTWQEIPFGELISDGPKNGIYKPASAYGSGICILRIDMFYDGEVLPWDNIKRLSITEKEKSDYALAIGDIVINRVNSLPYLGKSALIRVLPEPCVFESNMMRIRVDTSKILSEYCVRFLTSPEGLSQLRQNAKHAVNQASINQTDIKSVVIPTPPLEEQSEIVRRVESLFAYAERLEARYLSASERVERLTPSLLAKAFRGEFVEQDPNDESAEKLLEKVKVGWEDVPPQKTGLRGKRKK